MSYRAVSCPAGWAFDTSWKLSAGEAGVIKGAPYPGQPLVAMWRYVSLGTISPKDIDPTERDAILGAGWLLGLVQHVEWPHWSADPASGVGHGKAAVAHAQSVEYPPGCHIGLDMEGLGNAGAPVMGYVVAWADAVHAAGYRVLFYVGYDDGLTLAQHKSLQDGGYVDAWWSDFGGRALPEGSSWSVKQHVQTTVAGVTLDPDQIMSAGAIALMGVDDGDPLPHEPNVNTKDTDPAPPGAA